MNYAPIAIFVYKRPSHTLQMITSLMQCPEFEKSPVYVFCDGAKQQVDREVVARTRGIIRLSVGQNVQIIESDHNLGLANSIIAGVSRLLDDYDRVIVVEDDLVVSPGFLQYMNAALVAYEHEPSVMHVSGYMYMIPEFANRTEAMFLPFISSWGWATWKQAWACFDPQATGWEVLQTDEKIRSRFDLNNSYNYSNMIKRQMTGEFDSWAIRWYWSIFKNQGYTIFPPVSHVNNIGFDGSGSHGWFTARLLFSSKPKWIISKIHLPKIVSVNQEDFEVVKKTMSGSRSKRISILRNIKKILTFNKRWE